MVIAWKSTNWKHFAFRAPIAISPPSFHSGHRVTRKSLQMLFQWKIGVRSAVCIGVCVFVCVHNAYTERYIYYICDAQQLPKRIGTKSIKYYCYCRYAQTLPQNTDRRTHAQSIMRFGKCMVCARVRNQEYGAWGMGHQGANEGFKCFVFHMHTSLGRCLPPVPVPVSQWPLAATHMNSF